MPYPPPPWTLEGFALQTLHLLDVDRVRPLIPTDLKILSLLPGKTLGGVYIASYQAGSTLRYNELIVISGLIHQSNQWGGWISHIYVDHPDSLAGGREIWGLPKQMAQFHWNFTQNPSVQVEQDRRSLCSMACRWQSPSWSQSSSVPAFSLLDQRLLYFKGAATFNLHLAGLDLTIPPESPFREVDLGQAMLGFYANPLQAVVEPPVTLSDKTCSKHADKLKLEHKNLY